MNPFGFVRRHPILTILLVAILASGGLLASNEVKADRLPHLPAIDVSQIGSLFARLSGHGEHAEAEETTHHEQHRIVATNPKVMDVTITEPFVCQIRSRRHIEVCAMVSGYLQEVLIQEGQAVKKGDPLFQILPVVYQAKLDAEVAEAQRAELEYNNTRSLADRNVVSQNEVKLLQARLAKAQAGVNLARAELNFTNVAAPFDGIVDRLQRQLGSLINEGDVLTTLSDNSVMWVYFNVPEARYLEYMAERSRKKTDDPVQLQLADGSKFPEIGKIAAIEAKFNNETGNIPFRADFPNPNRLLRHGQTGTVLISRVHDHALVIPQRATFEILDKRYVFVIGEDGVVHQRLITIEHEKDDIFIVGKGLTASDKIVLEGVREVREGEKTEFEFQEPDAVLSHQKFHAE